MEEHVVNFLGDTPPTFEQPPKPRRYKKIAVVILCLIVILFTTGFIAKGIGFDDVIYDPTAYDPVTLEPKKPEGLLKRLKYFVFSKNKTLKGQVEDRINLLILGQGGPGHDGPYLTDTIIIASIKPSTNEVALISIPRDLGVNIPGYGWRKINHANAFGEIDQSGWGAAFATEVIEDTFDIDIAYYVRVDFKAFEEIIDEVGGVRVDVDRAFTDNSYPAANDEYQVVSFNTGIQTMDSNTALKYARSRHGTNGEGSDFARARRQQKIILALKEKLLAISTLANPIKINNIIKSLDNHITTNMEFPEIISHIKLAKQLQTDKIIHLVLDNGVNGYLKNGYSPNGAFILEPVNGNFDEINAVIKNIFEEGIPEKDSTPVQPTPELAPANIEILNGTWRAGLAARAKQQLIDDNLIISHIGNTIERPQYKSGIYKMDNTDSTDVMERLKETLGIPILETPPTSITAQTSTDVLVILGEDFDE